MWRLEVSAAVRRIYMLLGFKRLIQWSVVMQAAAMPTLSYCLWYSVLLGCDAASPGFRRFQKTRFLYNTVLKTSELEKTPLRSCLACSVIWGFRDILQRAVMLYEICSMEGLSVGAVVLNGGSNFPFFKISTRFLLGESVLGYVRSTLFGRCFIAR